MKAPCKCTPYYSKQVRNDRKKDLVNAALEAIAWAILFIILVLSLPEKENSVTKIKNQQPPQNTSSDRNYKF